MTFSEAARDLASPVKKGLSGYREGVVESFRLPEAAARDFRIDAMKGLAIVLVVIGHAVLILDVALKNSPQRLVINSFHMPLFFFLSGWLAYASTQRYPPGKLFSKRFVNLVVPFMSWYFIVGATWTLAFRNMGIGEYSWRLVENTWTGRWFLLVLFWCFVLLVLANRLVGRLKFFAYPLVYLVPLAIPALLGKDVSTPFLGLGMLTRVLLFFFAGYLICERKDGIAEAFHRRPALGKAAIATVLLAFPLLVVVGALTARSPGPVFYFYMGIPATPFDPTRILAMAVASLGTAWVFCVFWLKKTRRGIGWLAWIGNYTLDILVIHMAASYFSLKVLAPSLASAGTVGRVFGVLLMTVFALAFSLSVSIFLLRRSRVLAFLFLGKPYAREAIVPLALPARRETGLGEREAA